MLPIILGVRRAADAKTDQRLALFLDALPAYWAEMAELGVGDNIVGLVEGKKSAAQEGNHSASKGAALKNGVPKGKALAKALSVANQVLERDRFTCQYCGFVSRTQQYVQPRDWDAPDFKPESLVCACAFCQQCFQLEQVSPMGSGVLIYLPELSQPALNHLARAIYVAKAPGQAKKANAPEAEMADALEIRALADRALAALKGRQGEAKRRLGTDDPSMLAAALFEHLNEAQYQNRAGTLQGLRLLPLDRRLGATLAGERDLFPLMRRSWLQAGGAYAAFPLKEWARLFESLSGAELASSEVASAEVASAEAFGVAGAPAAGLKEAKPAGSA